MKDLAAHSVLILSQKDMAEKEVTLEDLHDSLKDIKRHLIWLYNIVNKGVTEGSKTTDWMACQIENQDT